MKCINISHRDFINLQELSGLHRDILRAKVSIWMEKHNTDAFPSLEELGISPKESTDPAVDDYEKEGVKSSEGFFTIPEMWEDNPNQYVTAPTSKETVAMVRRQKLNLSTEGQKRFDVLASVVGFDAALKDVIEQNGQVRSPEVVLQKELGVSTKGVSMQKIIPETVDELNPVEKIKKIVSEQNKKTALVAAAKLSDQLGIPYDVISQEEFNKLFPDGPLAAGFYHKGRVTFVDGLFDEHTALHEFVHPIIKSMSKDNPELFEKLYSDLLKSDEGFDVYSYVAEHYPELTPNSPFFMEEVLVQATERLNKNKELETKSWFKEFLFNIKQFLRKMFGRSINISKLNGNTTLAEFLDMINQGEKFKLDKEFLNTQDVEMFSKMYEDEVKELDNQVLKITQDVIDDFYSLVQKQVGNLTKDNSIFAAIKYELGDEFNEGILQVIRKNLNELSTLGNHPVKALDQLDKATEMEVLQHKLELFVATLARVDVVFGVFNKKADALSAKANLSKDDLEEILALQMYVDNWKKFYTDMSDGYFAEHYGEDSKLKSLFTRSRSKIEQVSSKINQVSSDLVFEEFYQHVKEVNKPIEAQALKELDDLKAAGKYVEYAKRYEQWYGVSPEEQTELNRLENSGDKSERYYELKYKSFNSQSISKEQLKVLASNMLGDANSISTLMESYLNVNDDIIGGFQSYISQFFNEIAGNFNAKQSTLLAKLDKVLEGTPYSGKLIGEGGLGLAIGKLDNVVVDSNKKAITEDEKLELAALEAMTNRTGDDLKRYDELRLKSKKLEQVDEYVFANNFRNYRAAMTELKEDVDKARIQYNFNPTEQNKKIHKAAVKALRKFEADYMNRDGVDEVYASDHLFDSPVGEMAEDKIEDIFTRMRVLTANTMADVSDFSIDDELNKLWVEYRQLFSLYDLNGNEKTDSYVDNNGNTVITNDKAIAELLNKHKEDTKDYYEYLDIPNKFENALNAYVETIDKLLRDGQISPTEHKLNLERWIKANTTVEIDESYFEKRKELVDERKQILSGLTEINNQIEDVTPYYDKIYDILKATKNESGQYNGNQLTKQQQEEIKDLSIKIEVANNSYLKLSGLTGDDYLDYVRLSAKQLVSILNMKETQRLEGYEQQLKDGIALLSSINITYADIKRIREIDKELRSMADTESTDEYLNTMYTLIKNDDTLHDAIKNIIEEDFGVNIYSTQVLEKAHIESLLESPEILEQLLGISPEFDEFFERNHFIAERVVFNSKGKHVGVTDRYVKTPSWNTTTPRDLDYYHAFSINNPAFPNGFIEVNGVPRVPNMSYKSKELKGEYTREKIHRDYVDAAGNLVLANVDNMGQWLPKTLEEGAVDNSYIDPSYKDMFENNRPLFDAMLLIKNHYLDNQEGLDNPQKTYLTYPNIRKQGTERNLYNTVFSRKEGVLGYINHKISSFLNVFRSQVDDVELGLISDTRAGNSYKLDEPLTRPISGVYRLPRGEVSTNIISSIGLHSYSVEHYKAARRAMPFMQSFNNALKSIVKDESIRNYEDKLKKLKLLKSSTTSESRRIKAIQNAIDKHLSGEEVIIRDNKVAATSQKIFLDLHRWLQQNASVVWFSWNIISSTTNYYSGKTFMYSRANSQNAYGVKDLAATRVKSAKVVRKLMKARYKKGVKDPMIQLLTVMDAIPDLAKKDAGILGARSLYTDFAAGTQRFTDRKYLGDSVPIHQFLATLHNHPVEINGKKIPLYDAITLDGDGRITTIDAVPLDMQIKYDQSGSIMLGSGIKKIMNTHQFYLQKSIGASNEFNQPEAYRTIMGRVSFFILKFLPNVNAGLYTTTFKKGSGRNFTARKNYATQTRQLGFYVGALTSITTALNTNKQLNKPQKDALRGVAIMVLVNVMLRLLKMGYLSNYDLDDNGEDDFTFDPTEEGAFSVLNKVNRVPDLPVVDAKKTTQFGGVFSLEEWVKMNALRTADRIIREQESTLPFVPWDPYARGLVPTIFNLAVSGSVVGENNIATDISDLIRYAATDDDYDKAAGPYIWQQKGVNKGWNIAMKYAFGIDGKIIDPAYAIKIDNTIR